MNFHLQLQAFQELGKEISLQLEHGEFDAIIRKQSIENKWFTEENCRFALRALARMLNKESCKVFYKKYEPLFQKVHQSQKIAVISAGNIPCAAFHDFFCILVSGHQFIGKLSKQDALLLPFLAKILIKIIPEVEKNIVFVEKLLNFDKIITTGSNNSARYFLHYFKDKPLLLRKNRNSIALLNGREKEEELQQLSIDVFQFFGLGCRSVSKIYIPKNYDFSKLIATFQMQSQELLKHSGYANNYEYHRAIFAMNRVPFYDCGSFLLLPNHAFASPIAVVFYEEYDTIHDVLKRVHLQKHELQCLVSNDEGVENKIPFGKAQEPSLFDYPDNEDIMFFCNPPL